jgi:hypothetical protein
MAAVALSRMDARQAGAEESRRLAGRLGTKVHEGRGAVTPACRTLPIRAVYLLLMMGLLVSLISQAGAMEFRIEFDPEEKTNVIAGEGPIVDGDAARLKAIIPGAGRDRYGNIRLYLNSPGGSVAAAFAMVKIMDREEFSAIVSSNAACASACASIVYISARFHEVVGNGKLGIHSCYAKTTSAGNPEPSSFCNDIIAKNAIKSWHKLWRGEHVARGLRTGSHGLDR